jgi:ABC-type microcin C transport system duplicated ATPase subunit YejF
VRPIDKIQRERLEANRKRLEFVFDTTWGALSPSSERQAVMYHVREAMMAITKILEMPEQLEFDLETGDVK